ncbi:MAG TPA: Spy/CpxP family protein refolding chaperone [Candidatus Aquilonibacter sp.]|nr:Spy/CpxP family protein refolding chaperone [Candidatus Aquilonibacter sp.]
MKRIAATTAIILFFPLALPAQRGRGMSGMRGERGARMPVMDEHTTLLVFAALLNLNDAQQQQLGAIFDAAVKAAAPLNTQIQDGKQALFEAIKSGKTENQVKAAQEQDNSAAAQLLALQTQAFEKMCTLLTPAQKAEVDDTMFTDIGNFLANVREPLPEPAVPQPAPPATAAPGINAVPSPQ